jgi:hypothetical protein
VLYLVNPVRNSSGPLNPAGIVFRCNPAALQRGIISNGVKIWPIPFEIGFFEKILLEEDFRAGASSELTERGADL